MIAVVVFAVFCLASNREKENKLDSKTAVERNRKIKSAQNWTGVNRSVLATARIVRHSAGNPEKRIGL